MPAKANNRQITLSFNDALFEAIDEKRHATRVSFQSLARALFTAWLRDFPGPNVDATVARVLRDENPYAKVPAPRPDLSVDQQIPEHLRALAARFVKFWQSPESDLEHRLKALLEVVLSDRGDTPEQR